MTTSKIPDLHEMRGKGRHSHRFTLRQIGKQVLATVSEGARHAHDVEGHITSISDDGPDHRHTAFVDGVTIESGPPIVPMELGLHKEEIYKGLPRPTPASALYVAPMEGKYEGQGRKCSNCMMWASEDAACVIHAREVHVTKNHVCGYHVQGDPVKTWKAHKNIQFVEPATSGLELVTDAGSKCSNCVAFTKSSTCRKVADPTDPAKNAAVDAQGCCALWEGKEMVKGLVPVEALVHARVIRDELTKGFMPDLIDPDHDYVFKTGEYGIYDYWYRDRAGNYWRYTNAPEDHEDFDPRAGVPLLDKDQPMPHTAPQFFAANGRRRHSAVPKDATAEINAAYDPLDPKQTWYETYQGPDGAQRFVYLDSDVRENLDLWVQYQLRVTDAGISRYRQFAANLFTNPHPKDKIVGAILMLVDQGLYDLEDLADALVEDLSFVDETVRLLGRKFVCDPPFFDFLTSLMANREPSDPLFVLDTVHGRHSFGYHYLYSVFKFLRVSPHYILYWRASQMFTRIMTRLALTTDPEPEEVEGLAMSELQRMFSTRDNIKHMVDHKVREQLLSNYGVDLQKALARQEHDDYGVPAIWSDLIQRRGDEMQFSTWLHAEPMHDITPEEEAQIAEQVEAAQEARGENDEEPAPGEAGGAQQPGQPGPGESGGGTANEPPPAGGA